MMHPTQDELLVARYLGHEPDYTHCTCSCSWRAEGHRGVILSYQVSNHIWRIILEAQELRAQVLGGSVCPDCRNGVRFTGEECTSCDGRGLMFDGDMRDQLFGIAVHYGHEAVPGGGCTCGDGGGWTLHAIEVAKGILAELDAFEKELKHG